MATRDERELKALRQVKRRATDLVLVARHSFGEATVDSSMVFDLAKALLDVEYMLREYDGEEDVEARVLRV